VITHTRLSGIRIQKPIVQADQYILGLDPTATVTGSTNLHFDKYLPYQKMFEIKDVYGYVDTYTLYTYIMYKHFGTMGSFTIENG
jgi:hypothetical protein